MERIWKNGGAAGRKHLVRFEPRNRMITPIRFEGPWESWRLRCRALSWAEGDAPAMSRPRKYSDELRERAVRFYFESNRPIAHVAQDLGIHREALRQWVRQAEADRGVGRDLLKTDERDELKRLRKENAELRRANAILKDASVYFAPELDPPRRR